MAYEFTSIKESDPVSGDTITRTYIICTDCRQPVGQDPKSSEWAAWDAPISFNPDGTTNYEQHTPLCAECYSKAFTKRYPGAEPPLLYDGRVRGASPVKETNG